MATSWKVGWLSLRCNWNFSYIALKRLCKGSRRFFWEFENLNLIQLAITTTLEPGNLKIGNRKFVSSICQGDGTGLELVSRMMMMVMIGDDGGGVGDVDLPGGGHQGTRMELVKNCRKASATTRAECAGLELLQPCGGYKVIQTLCFRIFTAFH